MPRLIIGAVLLTAALSVHAQERIAAGPPPNGPAFDAVSIKRNVSDVIDSRSVGERPGGVFQLSGMAIAPVIRTAYPADVSELIGAPAWVSSEIYDLTARANRDVTREEMQAMLQRMLAERFKLTVHYEVQERPVYALVVARSDGRLGPQIKKSDLDCDAIQAARRAGSKEPAPVTSNGAPSCGMAMRGTIGMEVLLGARPLSTLASALGSGPGRIVVDKTGLTGNYDVTLNYIPQPSANPQPGEPPSLFTAVEEQLGLRLQPDRAMLRVVVIDRIERPTDN